MWWQRFLLHQIRLAAYWMKVKDCFRYKYHIRCRHTLTRADLFPNCAGADDNVVQIMGNYENVKSALFQVTGRLRQNLFSGAVPKGADWRHGSYSPIPTSSPDGRDASSSTELVQSSRLSYFVNWITLDLYRSQPVSYQPGSQLGQANSISSIPEPVDGAHGLTTFPSGLKQERNGQSEAHF
ncbi:UNVERIFIED_CONTAM: hypothetical protein Sangu_2543200 [Sesamum angustifolium]|uniref:Uncharacterized protein n=1 Tax=Sesamum angustifolium TaxID=2727405 RepID=A0AAW2J9Y1_9LAMI